MIPVSALASAFYIWAGGLPDIERTMSWAWIIFEFAASIFVINCVFSGIFNFLASKEKIGISDCVKVTAGVLIAFLVFAFLVETRR